MPYVSVDMSLDVLWSLLYFFQICVWSMDGWEKQASKFLQIPAGRAPNPLGQTRVQFHQDQTHVLVVHETQLALYEAPKLDCIKQVHVLSLLKYLMSWFLT